MKKILIVMGTAVLVAGGIACSSNSASPSASKAASAAASAGGTSSAAAESSADGSTRVVTNDLSGVSLSAPTPNSPNDGFAFKYAEQPLGLEVKNAVSTGATPTYTFQVASDAAFATIVNAQDNVAQGTNVTKVVLPKLAGAKTYYWRSRATSSGTVGLFSVVRSFSVGPEVVLQAPALASPTGNAQVSGTLVLTVNNVQRSGPVTAITYRFDLSDSSAFGRTLASTVISEQSGASTTLTPNVTLGAGTYYWRVQAFDNASGVSSPVSAVASFQYTPFSLSQATMVSSPQDFANWAETAKITRVTFFPDWFEVDFTKREGPDRWPDTPFGDGSLEYTLGLCVNPSGTHWYCSAVVQFWFGRELSASAPPRHIGLEWFYDGGRWGPIAGYQPSDGETVGVFVCAGNCRNNDAGDRSYVKERSNVAFVPWSNSGNGNYTFSNGVRIK